MTTEPHYLETLYKDLALALGDAVWAFARIEWLVYEQLGRLSTDRIDELVGDMNFRHRANILRRLVERRATDEVKRERALSAIQAAEALSDRRNIIVHNPWRIWVDLNAKEFMTEIQKYSNREKKVNLDDLRKFAADAEAAESALREALGAL
ncbi:MAG: hypothetical protein A3H91_10170 [Gammaproteobacteria bacterium RIFCSPLOWO2_02_FULL_61_13]|nr:MAG: hypothetical protein A3H91_10170 [Gammaproteobacteria bacterium RIFCSPLOWO2_02_FULL_61_13]